MEDQKKRRKMKKTTLNAFASSLHSMEDSRRRSFEAPESRAPSTPAAEEEKDEEDSPPRPHFHSPKTTVANATTFCTQRKTGKKRLFSMLAAVVVTSIVKVSSLAFLAMKLLGMSK